MEGGSKAGEWKGWREGVRWEEERESEGQEEVSVHVFGGRGGKMRERKMPIIMSRRIGPYKNTRCH